ncbi:MAG TPA: 50S ribosomal protein L11 methyltransferase, partial [Candidatus Binatia bacterium]|nr:50S ribosomal protein L11 methyltransferase [Candidatus Binatia bacterium]
GSAGDALVESAVPSDAIAGCLAALDGWVASLADVDPRARAIRVAAEPAANVDWAEVWRRHHRPLVVGQRFVVAPPWDVPAVPDREVLVIDPGMAFGTGQHATTRTCLEAIETAVAGGRVRSVLDVGTGSGILALAAARLGIARVVAIDTDPAVLALARANLTHNGARAVLVAGGSAAAVRAAFDLVVANLLADALVTDAPALARVVAPGGRLVVSGVTAVQLARVLAAWPGWQVVETRAEDEWRTLALERAG